jgi:hypothetical protein
MVVEILFPRRAQTNRSLSVIRRNGGRAAGKIAANSPVTPEKTTCQLDGCIGPGKSFSPAAGAKSLGIIFLRKTQNRTKWLMKKRDRKMKI